ncbi:hypothetical protein RhiirA4_542589 [Rhizophagus irregularis]|uniref:Uncharacterized protein n=1 Tax=Rhizophagus irregularis TaxID=588596 RepID=A0A2I1GFM1_9GLOM|nr:hypothetical protein RhiirA4_542589 [Rhizophagus irregularis]
MLVMDNVFAGDGNVCQRACGEVGKCRAGCKNSEFPNGLKNYQDMHLCKVRIIINNLTPKIKRLNLLRNPLANQRMICTDNNKLRQLIARDDKRLKDISGPLTGAQRKTNQIRKAKRGDRNEEAVLNEFNIASNTSYTNQSPTSSGTFQFPTPITTTNFHPSLYNSYTNPLYNLPSSLHNTHTNSSLNGSYMHLANLYIHSPTHPPTYPSYLLLTLLLTLLLNLYTQPTYLNNSNTSLLEILNNNEESKRRKMDGEDYKPYFHVKIPPPRVVTPPHLPRTPEHQTFSLSYFVSPTTSESEETDSDDSDAMTRIMMTMIRREFYWTIQLRLMKMVKKIP